jgi:hypothetical protein
MERIMVTLRKNMVTLYVDRSSGQWVVLDPDGRFWIVSSVAENPWDQRQPFQPGEDTELELVPGHYKHMLGLPA